jgi:predicted Zn-dependent peptidase
MLSLAFSKKSLEVQRKVVCEEFKEHYINKPYGDAWHKLRELSYTTHPYKWMTIGKNLEHIEHAKLDDVKAFFFKHYRPVNAILVVAGNVKTEDVKKLAEKWFGNIDPGEKYIRSLPQEPRQTAPKILSVKKDVPLDAFYKTWHMPGRMNEGYHAADLITDILGGGGSSRLFQSLVKEKRLFSNIECYHFGSLDAGLFTIEGKLVKGVDMQHAELAVEEELAKLRTSNVSEEELQKVKNKTESTIAFEDITVMSRANSLAFYELLGDASLINQELSKYNAVTAQDIQHYSHEILDADNSNVLYYYSNN